MTDRRLVDSFWDLRDDAYDHPEHWQGVTAEALFQKLAEFVEEGGEPVNWVGVAGRMIAWRLPKTDTEMSRADQPEQ